MSVSPVLVGGSGLKPPDLQAKPGPDVSPVLVGGSGLKQRRAFLLSRGVPGFSRPGGREWIETGFQRREDAGGVVSPVLVGGSGLKLSHKRGANVRHPVSPVLVGGSGLKPHQFETYNSTAVSPVLVGGSGLKLRVGAAPSPSPRFLPSWWAGVD